MKKLSELDGETMLFCNELGFIVSKDVLLEYTWDPDMKKTCYLVNERCRQVRMEIESYPLKADYETGDVFDVVEKKDLNRILRTPEAEAFLKLLNEYPLLHEIGEEIEDDC